MRDLFSIVLAMVLSALATYAGAQTRETWPSTPMLTAATTTASGATLTPVTKLRTFQALGTTTAGAGSATIVIEVTNVETPTANADWITAGTITLTLGTTQTTDGFASAAPWLHVRARVTAISGTNATVSVRMGA